MFDVNLFFTEIPWLGEPLRKMLEKCQENGVKGGLISPLDARLERVTERFNERLLEELRKTGFNDFYVAIAVNPEIPFEWDSLRSLSDDKRVRALRIYPLEHEYQDNSSVLEKAFEMALKLNLPLMITCRAEWGKPVPNIGLISKIASKFKDVSVILTGLNYSETLQIVKTLQDLNNVSVEISFFHQLNGLELLVTRLGEDRVLFGSAFPLQNLEVGILKLLMSRIDENARRLVARENALRILGLEG